VASVWFLGSFATTGMGADEG